MGSFRCSWSLLAGLSVLVCGGCEESPNNNTSASSGAHVHGHEAHDHGPESLADAFKELTSMRNTIRDAFAKNDPDTAHDPLHEVGHVLNAIPELAKKEKVSAENQTAIEKSVNDLMDAFGRVDKTLHGQEGSTFSQESATIDATLESLAGAIGVTSPETETSASNAPPELPQETPAAVEETASPSEAAAAPVSEDGKGE